MRTRRPVPAALLGLLAAVPAAVLALVLAAPGRPADRYAARTPAGHAPRFAPPPRPGWAAAEQASLALLRRVTRDEARRTRLALARCVSGSRAGTPAGRVLRYRHCALRPMARTGGMASSTSHMLFQLADDAAPSAACGQLVRELAGGTGALGSLTSTALRTWVGAPWAEVRESSRSIQWMAGSALRLASSRQWARACHRRSSARPRVLRSAA